MLGNTTNDIISQEMTWYDGHVMWKVIATNAHSYIHTITILYGQYIVNTLLIYCQ